MISVAIGCGCASGGMYERISIDVHFNERGIEIIGLMELGE
tara:strand:- start:1550 stop:1672 length:123 start_codon:yes stop_codon:yes gene_type:complete